MYVKAGVNIPKGDGDFLENPRPLLVYSRLLLHTFRKNMICKVQGIDMQELEQNVLEQYNMEISSTRKIRGAVLCETNKGLFLLKEITTSEKRIPALCELYTRLYEQGYHRIDYVVTNRNGEYISALDNGDRYILKKCFAGRECDIKKTREIFEAAGNLAKLHIIMRYELEHGIPEGTKTDEKYRRHNRELKKVRQFTRKVVPKGEFEFAFLKQFDQMYQWAEAAVEELDRSDYEKLYAEEMKKSGMIHGEYNYHNIIMTKEGIATTNFEKFRRDIQVEDLYYFLRKVLEKSGWKLRLGDGMLNAYSAIHPLTEGEMEYLKIRLIYPEKFWKTANSYYCTNKAWISVKNIEKLQTAIRQTEEKKMFLKEVFGFEL